MLCYNFDRIFRNRGIDRPYTYLVSNGFSPKFATKVNNNKVVKLHTNELERLCLLLHCTPNDLMLWTPDNDQNKNHPLNKLLPYDSVNMIEALKQVPLEKMKEIEQLIREKAQGK